MTRDLAGPPDTEDALQARLADDVDGAFEALVVAHQHRLYALVLGMSGDPGQAEEVVQDAFLRAHRALGRYPRQRILELRLGPWLRTIALNAFRNAVRRKRPAQHLAWDPPDQPAYGAEPEALTLRRAEQERLLRALGTIPPATRSAILLRHADDRSVEEVAEILNLPIGTVKSHVHRGLQRLRRTLAEAEEEA